MIKGGKLRSFGEITKILGKEGILGFEIPVDDKVTAQQAIELNKAKEELPSTSDVAKADDIELQKIKEIASRSMENVIVQLEGKFSDDLPMQELLGLDKHLRSIKGSLKVEVVTKGSVGRKYQERKAKARRNPRQPRIQRWDSRRLPKGNQKV